MATVTINELPDTMKKALENRAAERGLSLEAHIREILQDSFSTPPRPRLSIVEAARKYFGPENGVELDLSRDWPERPPVEFQD